MTTALILLAYAAVLVVAGPRVMDRAGWAQAAPRLAIATWFTLAASAISAVSLAGVAIVMPMDGFTGSPQDIVATCVAALQARYGPAEGIALAILAAAMTWLVPLAPVIAGLVLTRRTIAERARLRAHLVAADFDPAIGAWVVPARRAAAYCIPGAGGGTIVVTSAAVEILDRRGLDAVLAHERAHLAARHHFLVGAARAARTVLGFLPLFAVLPDRIGQLVELAADDAATRASGRHTLARSLLEVAAARTAAADALAASGGDVVTRIERLLDDEARPGAVGRGPVLGSGAAAIAAPFLIAAAPLLTAAGMACCPI